MLTTTIMLLLHKMVLLHINYWLPFILEQGKKTTNLCMLFYQLIKELEPIDKKLESDLNFLLENKDMLLQQSGEY